MYDLTCKVALVTGAASKRGFGRAIATRLAREGADVVVTGRTASPHRNRELKDGWRGLEAVTDEIKALGRKALVITCDITKSDEVDKMVEDTVKKFGQIDILVNNAGIHTFSTIDKMSNETWSENISVNLTGTFFCSRAVAREMIKRSKGGKIINIASVNGKAGSGSGSSAYSASKFGVIGLTQSLALELAPHSINVNSVCPTLGDTDMAWENFESEAKRDGITVQEAMERLIKKRVTSIPLRRLVTGEDVANMVAFLASKEAEYITGQSINVDGGFLMAH
jgi:NAD(P)-dependent dehydrogenase (short-subunit alcohol dehydrogenase family)